MFKLTLEEARAITLTTRNGLQFNLKRGMSTQLMQSQPGIMLFLPVFVEFINGTALRDTPLVPYSIMSDNHLETLSLDGHTLGVLSKGSGYVDVNPAVKELEGIACYYVINRH